MRLVADDRERLDRFLARHLPQFTRSRLSSFIEEGGVRVSGKEPKPGLMLKAGMTVELELPEEKIAHDLTPFKLELDVVFEDESLLVVNKPRGLAAHPAASLKEPSLVNALLARGGGLSEGSASYRPGIVHRLDKDTTGLMVVAKTGTAHHSLAKQFAAKHAERRYAAVVAGDLKEERMTISAPLARDKWNRFLMAVDPNGKPAVTHIVRLQRIDAGTLLAVRLETGRTHQVRAHLKAIGHAVLGDRLYALKEHQKHPLQLHAGLLAFDHPISGERMTHYASPPEDFLAWEQVDRTGLERFDA